MSYKADASIPSFAMRWLNWQERHGLLTNILLAVVILILDLPLGLIPLQSNAPGAYFSLTVITCFLCGLGIALRGRWPVLAWAMVTFLPQIHLGIVIYNFHPTVRSSVFVAASLSAIILLGTPLALATLANRYRLLWAWLACLVSTLVATGCQSAVGGYHVRALFIYLLPCGLANVIGVLMGILMRVQQLQLIQLQKQSSWISLSREQTAQLAAADERNRIAREMHDIVAHSLAIMITLTDGALAAVDANPQTAKRALKLLGETGRSALADTRRLVGVLRDEPHPQPAAPDASTSAAPPAAQARTPTSAAAGTADLTPPASLPVTPQTTGAVPVVRQLPVPEFAPPGVTTPQAPNKQVAKLQENIATAQAQEEATPLAPAPEVTDLDTLIRRFQEAGVPLEYTWNGAPLPDDKGLQLTLFRIAQESLTNILRYAPTTKHVYVLINRHRGMATLEIDNDAAPQTSPMHGSGKGLIGMRERAAVYGGTVNAGSTPNGWQVRAILRWNEDNEGSSPWQLPQ